MSESLVKANNKVENLEDYDELLCDIRGLLERAKYHAYKAVDNLRVQTYWQIGERIVREELQHKERADYGKRVIEMLAVDIGFDRRLFYRIVKFYRMYQIVATVSPQLSWSHYEALITMGQMNKYLNYYKENRKYEWELDPIGLIICEYKGKEEVHYALGCLSNRIFVAEYKAKLPREKEIEKKLNKIQI